MEKEHKAQDLFEKWWPENKPPDGMYSSDLLLGLKKCSNTAYLSGYLEGLLEAERAYRPTVRIAPSAPNKYARKEIL